ncbi:MAG TPA: hypothetical protein QGG37_11475 [Chloroflexota bacterium]|nr:hypothetical protein [Chloroflexota bacterium]
MPGDPFFAAVPVGDKHFADVDSAESARQVVAGLVGHGEHPAGLFAAPNGVEVTLFANGADL